MEGANLYVVDGGDVVSPRAPVAGRNPKSAPQRTIVLDGSAPTEARARRRRRHHPALADPVAPQGDLADPDDPDRRGRDDDDVPTKHPRAGRRYEPDRARRDAATAADAGHRCVREDRATRAAAPGALPTRGVHATAAAAPNRRSTSSPPTPAPDPLFSGADGRRARVLAGDAAAVRPSCAARSRRRRRPAVGGLPPAPALDFEQRLAQRHPAPGRPALPRPRRLSRARATARTCTCRRRRRPRREFESGGNGFGGGFPRPSTSGAAPRPSIVRRSGPPGFVVLLT